MSSSADEMRQPNVNRPLLEQLAAASGERLSSCRTASIEKIG
ncbi:MAG: hypothetical protein U0840_30860 [Gemmataceae bacterium]